MASYPLVSVIIPLFNSEQYISETIESVLAQTYQNIEVIVIDDGSTDNSLSVAKAYESEIVHVYHQPNQGAQVARNFGFEVSKGAFIQFLDADDMLSSTKIERQIQALLAYDEDCIATCPVVTFGNGSYNEWRQPYYHNYETGFDLLVDLWGFFAPSWCHACYLTPRRLIEKAGNWDIQLLKNQDGEFFSRVLVNTKSVVFVDGEYMIWRILPTSTSHKASFVKTASVLLSYNTISSLLLTREDSNRVRCAIAIAYGSFIINDSDRYHSTMALMHLKEMGISPNYRISSRFFRLLKRCLHPRDAMIVFRFFQKVRGKRVCFSDAPYSYYDKYGSNSI